MAASASVVQNRDVWKVIAGQLVFFLHKGQQKALNSLAQVVAVIAGTQSGKTVFGPIWLLMEMMKCGPGEYGVISPTFSLMEKKALKEFLKLFEKSLKLGSYNKSERVFIFHEEGLDWLFGRTDVECTVIFGYAENPDSLESMTLKAVWCDEAGQKQFKGDSYEALRRRLNVHEGRMLITTTPYDLGWLKRLIWDRWKNGDTDIDVISFRSIDNPGFPKEQYYKARARMPKWKFDLFYNAIFTKPAGTIYDCFNEGFHVVPSFAVPADWVRPWGNDFGQVNTACCKIAINPHYDPDGNINDPWNRKYYVYQTYLSGSKTVKEHVLSLKAKERQGVNPRCVGGAPSEDEWRQKFTDAGLYIKRPQIESVEVGIDHVYGLLASGELAIMDNCDRLINDLNAYSRELDKNDEPTEKIADKATYHRLDALRYVGSELVENPSFVSSVTVLDSWHHDIDEMED